MVKSNASTKSKKKQVPSKKTVSPEKPNDHVPLEIPEFNTSTVIDMDDFDFEPEGMDIGRHKDKKWDLKLKIMDKGVDRPYATYEIDILPYCSKNKIHKPQYIAIGIKRDVEGKKSVILAINYTTDTNVQEHNNTLNKHCKCTKRVPAIKLLNGFNLDAPTKEEGKIVEFYFKLYPTYGQDKMPNKMVCLIQHLPPANSKS